MESKYRLLRPRPIALDENLEASVSITAPPCNGAQPCQPCLDSQFECVYVKESKDELQEARAEIERLKTEIDLYKALFDRLKITPGNLKHATLSRLDETNSPRAVLEQLQKGIQQAHGVDCAELGEPHQDLMSQSHRSEGHGPARSPPKRNRHCHIDELHPLLQQTLIPGGGAVESFSTICPIADQPTHATQSVPLAALDPSTIHHQRENPHDVSAYPAESIRSSSNRPVSSAVGASLYASNAQSHPQWSLLPHGCNIPSLYFANHTPLSNLFYSFRSAAIEMLSNGTPVYDVLGPSDCIDVELFFRDREQPDSHNPHTWACEILKTMEGFDPFVLLASCALYSTYMRWCILPSAVNYTLMPEMIRPTEHQRFSPRRIPIGLVQRPEITNASIKRFRNLLSPGTDDINGTCGGWEHGLEGAIQLHPVTGRRILTAAFIKHGTNPDNWSLGSSITTMYPEIEGIGFHIRP